MSYQRFKTVKASGVILWTLDRLGFIGWTSVWGVIYLHPDHVNNTRLIDHEQCHAMQMQRDGRVCMLIKYTYYLMRYGYKNNPYEIEANNIPHLTEEN